MATLTKHAAATPEDGTKLITVKEASGITRLGRTTIYQAMERGELPYFKFGRARRIGVNDLMQFVESARIGSHD